MMTRSTKKALELFCRVVNSNNMLEHAYENEVGYWTRKRDRELASFRKAMAKVTLEEFLAGITSTESRMEQWRDMTALLTETKNPSRWQW